MSGSVITLGGSAMSVKSLVRRVRPVLRRVPVIGHGLRYAKRLVFLPWNFHKLLVAWSAAPPAETAHAAAWASAAATQATVWTATQSVAHVAEGQTWLAADHVVGHVVGQVRLAIDGSDGRLSTEIWTAAGGVRTAVADVVRDVAAELRRLNETHAACYDRLNDAARCQATDLRAVAAAVAELAARVDDLAAGMAPPTDHRNGHTPAILRRVG